MSDLEPTLKKSPQSPQEEAAGALTQAAADQGAPAVHDAVGERIWRGVEAGLHAPRVIKRPRWHVAVAASVVAVAMSAAFAALKTDDRPHIVAGTAFVLDGGKTLRVTEAPLAWESKVIAGPEGTTIEAGGARLVVSKRSVIVFLSRERHELKDGSALYEVNKTGFGLTMGPWDVRVTGTRFWVLQSERENVIEVYEGSVRLRSGSREIDLRAGDTFREVLGGDRHTALDSVVPKSSPPPEPPEKTMAPKKIDTPREPTLSEALARVRSGRYAEAERMYRRIAESSPDQAEMALYALAKMKLQKQRDVDAGLRILSELEQSHPQGALRQERLLTQIEILFRNARCDEAKRAVSIYVKEFTHAIDSLREIDASQCAK